MKLYPEGYDGQKMSEEQRGQYVEQKEVREKNHLKLAAIVLSSCNRSIKP